MKANISNRWMNEAVELVKEHDFDLNNVHDGGGKCEFCGQQLKYVAVIEAETNGDITRNVGLDCLEHVLGSTWRHMARAKSQAKKLKAKAREKRLEEKYGEGFEKHLAFLKYIEGTTYDNAFLSDMRRILDTRERRYTKNMAEAVQRSLEKFKEDYQSGNKNLKTKAQRQAEFKPVLERVRKLYKYVTRMERETDIASRSRYRKPASAFVKSVLDYAEKKMKVSEKQMASLETIYNRYQKYEQQHMKEEA